MASVTDAELKGMTQEDRVKALGMTTDQLTGRSMYIEFDPDATERFSYPWAPDVDFNKRTRWMPRFTARAMRSIPVWIGGGCRRT